MVTKTKTKWNINNKLCPLINNQIYHCRHISQLDLYFWSWEPPLALVEWSKNEHSLVSDMSTKPQFLTPFLECGHKLQQDTILFLLYYRIHKPNIFSNGPPQTYRIEDLRTSTDVKDLVTGRSYEAWVTATTRAGEGAATRRVSHTPSPRGKMRTPTQSILFVTIGCSDWTP